MNDQTATTITSGEYFRSARLDRGLTISDAARKTNLSESTIRRIEQSGVTRSFVVTTILPLLSAYDIEGTDELFECSDIASLTAEIDKKISARLARLDERQASASGTTGN